MCHGLINIVRVSFDATIRVSSRSQFQTTDITTLEMQGECCMPLTFSASGFVIVMALGSEPLVSL